MTARNLIRMNSSLLILPYHRRCLIDKDPRDRRHMAAAPRVIHASSLDHLDIPPFSHCPSLLDGDFHSNIMAANTRYEPAPQRDSFEEPFTHAPPSYQATAEPEPRTEHDNLPDDFKVRYQITILGSLQRMLTNPPVRRRYCRRHDRHSDAVRPQGVLDLVSIRLAQTLRTGFHQR